MTGDSSVDWLFLAFQAAVVGRYSLERELGRGGMGVVYLAREVRLDRPVAIKLLPPELAAQASLRDRFLREARTAARLSHPYIVPIHAVDEIGEFVFYVMAYVDGETLAQRVATRGPLSPNDATRVLREVAWALAYAHAQGVVHRDVKPANILLERGTERAMVTDFGIARVAQGDGETGYGEVLGTPEYMSPEQAAGDAVDGRSDLYALGAVGFFALTGRPPFVAPTTQAVLAQHITKAAPPVSSAARGVPASLSRAIDQCLEKDPARRPATGEILADMLAPTLAPRADIPVPVRVFLDRRRMGALTAPPVIFISMLAPISASAARHVIPFGVKLGLVAAGIVAFTLPIAILIGRMRSVLRAGYGPADLAAALRTRFERLREEFQYEYGAKLSIREKLARGLAVVGIAGAVVSLAVIPHVAHARVTGPFFALSAYVGVIGGALSARFSRLRKDRGSRWARFWEGKPGRLIARAASIRLGQRAIPADRPTEFAIALSAEALFGSLPKPMRESLGDVPAALRALEAHAHAARARIDEINATLTEAQRGSRARASDGRQEALVADLHDARARAEERLSEVVTALENVRLDLLRLHAGVGSPEGITQDLAAARMLSEDADRLLAGVKEAEASLER
jgi:serine/threonine-protein kinase